jgi:hypothetical protein
MIPTALQSPAGGYVAAVRFHDGRLHTPTYTRFDRLEEAHAFAEGWIERAVREHARLKAAMGGHLRLVEG